MPDTTLETLLTTVPNLAIAVWSLWWSFQRVEAMQAANERLVSLLVNRLTAEDTQEIQAIIDTSQI